MNIYSKISAALLLAFISFFLVPYPASASSSSSIIKETSLHDPFILNPLVRSYSAGGDIASLMVVQNEQHNDGIQSAISCTSAKSSTDAGHAADDGIECYVMSGTWSLQVHNGTLTHFDARFKSIRTDGSRYHVYEITSFRQHPHTPAFLDLNGTIFTGSADIKYDGNFIWYGVPIKITIAKHDVIKISMDSTYTDNIFGSQPVYGIVTKLHQLVQ